MAEKLKDFVYQTIGRSNRKSAVVPEIEIDSPNISMDQIALELESIHFHEGERVGRIISIDNTKAANVGVDGSMRAAAKVGLYCLFRPYFHPTKQNIVRARWHQIIPTRVICSPEYQFHFSDIELMPEVYQNKDAYIDLVVGYKKVKEEELVDRLSYVEEQIEKILSPIETPFNKINFYNYKRVFFGNKKVLQVVCTTERNTIIKYASYYGERIHEMLSHETDCGDYVVYLPTQWVAASGYTEKEVREWLYFINTLETGVTVELLGIESREEFKPYPTKRDMAGVREKDNFQKYLDVGAFISKNEFYHVKINSCECGQINNFIFNLIISLYHSWTPHVPGLTLQIKEAFGDKIDSWRSLLLALNTNTETVFSEIRGPENSRPRYINPFSTKNDMNSYLSKLNPHMRLSQAFCYNECTVEKSKKIEKAFEEKDYEKLFEIFKSFGK